MPNGGAYITAAAGLRISLMGESGGAETRLSSATLADPVGPGERSDAVEMSVPDWADYDRIYALVDDPAVSGGSVDWGVSKECDEDNNTADVDTSSLCE